MCAFYAGEIVFLILAGKSAGAKQVLTFLLRRAEGKEGKEEKRDGGQRTRNEAICDRVEGARIRRRHGCLGKSKRNTINGH